MPIEVGRKIFIHSWDEKNNIRKYIVGKIVEVVDKYWLKAEYPDGSIEEVYYYSDPVEVAEWKELKQKIQVWKLKHGYKE